MNIELNEEQVSLLKLLKQIDVEPHHHSITELPLHTSTHVDTHHQHKPILFQVDYDQ